MRILLDTHIFIWWHDEPERLSARAFALCDDPANTLVLSIASVWEMQIKLQLDKLVLSAPLPQIISDQQQTNNLQILPITLPHVLALDALPPHHKDPFDRLLIAQSNAENIALLSADAMFDRYAVTLA